MDAVPEVSNHPKGDAMTSRTTHRRIATVVLAPAAAVAAWAVFRLAGVELDVSSGDGTVDAADVAVAALVGALAAWPVARSVDAHSRYPRRTWGVIGAIVLGTSMSGPSWLADGGSAVALMCLHLVTGIVVITGFAGTLPVYRRRTSSPALARAPSGNPAP
jgi:hypothetical protein